MRAGTENVAGIAGFGAAAAAAMRYMAVETARIVQLRDEYERRLLEIVPGVTIFGKDAPRLPNTSAFSLPGLSAERALILFDMNNVSLSSGSACSSGKVKRSHVLEAMGIDDKMTESALRVSFGWSSTMADVELMMSALSKVMAARKHEAQAAA